MPGPTQAVAPIPLAKSASETQLAVAGPRVVVAWNASSNGRVVIGWALSTDGGLTFPTTGRVLAANIGDPIATAAPDGSLYVGGLGIPSCDGGACSGQIVIARSASGTSFAAPAIIDNPNYCDHPWLDAASDGRLTVLYNPRAVDFTAKTFAGSAMLAATSTDGTIWETHDIVPFSRTTNVSLVTGSVDGTTSWALFADDTAAGGMTLEKSADGKTWSRTTPLPSDALAIRAVARGDDVYVLFGVPELAGNAEAALPLFDSLTLVRSRDGGATWDAAIPITKDPRKYLLPELTIEPSGALDLVAYAGKAAGDPNATFEWTRSIDAGASWRAPIVLDSKLVLEQNRQTPARLGDYVAARYLGGIGYFAWTNNTSGQSAVVFAHTDVR
jgi:hypothetical protein